MVMVALPSTRQPPASIEQLPRPVADRAARATVDDQAPGAWQTPRPVTARQESVWRSPTFYLVPFILCYLLVACGLVVFGGAVRRGAKFVLGRS